MFPPLCPVLYETLGPAGILHPTLDGNNGMGEMSGYCAGPGWNAATGWGTPDGGRLLQVLKSLKDRPSPMPHSQDVVSFYGCCGAALPPFRSLTRVLRSGERAGFGGSGGHPPPSDGTVKEVSY